MFGTGRRCPPLFVHTAASGRHRAKQMIVLRDLRVPRGSSLAKERIHRRVQGVTNVGVVGQWAHQRHAACCDGFDTLGNQVAGVDQQTGRNAFVQAVPLEIARAVCDLHQLLRSSRVDAAFRGHDFSFNFGVRIVEIQCAKALLGRLFQILHQALIAGVV